MKVQKTNLYSRFGLTLIGFMSCAVHAQTTPSESVTFCYSGTVTNVAVTPPQFPGGPPNSAPFAAGSAFYYRVRINRTAFSQASPTLRQYLIQGGGMSAAANIGGRGYSFVDGNFNISNGTTADSISSDVLASAQPFPASNTLAFFMSVTYDANPWSSTAITLPTDLPPVSQATLKTFASRFGLNAWGSFSGVIEGESCGPLDPGLLSIPLQTLPPAAANTAYSPVTLISAGGRGAERWSLHSGTLPAGLTLSQAGVLASGSGGITAQPDTYTFTVQVQDVLGSIATRQLSLLVNPDPNQPRILTEHADLANAYPGQPYTDQLDATGGTTPYTWVKLNGNLPPGLTLLSTGVITGVVDYQLATAFSYTFTAQVTTNGGQQATKTLTMEVIQPPTILNITKNGNGHVTSPVGIDCGWACSVTLPRGTTFLLTASWESGYRFDGWSSGCVSTINGCTVLLDSNKEITATFSRTGSSVTLTFGPINLAIISKTGVQSLRNWTINIANGGTGDLNLLQLTRFQLTQTGGAACAPVMLLPLPADVPDLAAGRSTDFQVPINFTGCAGNARFTLDMTVARQGTAPARAIKLLNQFQ
jgi:hypothetical protein